MEDKKKKVFQNPEIEIVNLKEEDIIVTSGFGEDEPGDNPINY